VPRDDPSSQIQTHANLHESPPLSFVAASSFNQYKEKNHEEQILAFPVAVVCGRTAVTPLQAASHRCSNATAEAQWAYSYTGSIFTASGWVPAAAVGRFHQDAAGNITGSQVRTVAGNAAAEDISGTFTVNRDCTVTGLSTCLLMESFSVQP